MDEDVFILQGPTAISEWFSQKLKKHIYILSDTHDRLYGCKAKNGKFINIDELLKMTIKDNTDKLMDFYFEAVYRNKYDTKVYNYKDSFMSDAFKAFENCFEVSKTNCKYKNVRFHYVDIRGSTDILLNIDNLQSQIKSIRQNPESGYTNTYIKILAQYIMDELPELKILFVEAKIMKQINNIRNSLIYDGLYKFLLDEGLPIYATLKSILSDILQFNANNMSIAELEDFFSKCEQVMVNFTSYIMDCYTLARMFRSFKNTRNSITVEDPKYIIIYVGGNHARRYERLLEFIGMQLVGKNEGEPKMLNPGKSTEKIVATKCIRVGLRLPFFHHAPDTK